MFWVIISILCFFLFKRFISKLEYEENRSNWRSIKFPLYIWIFIVLCCCLPIINFIVLIWIEIFVILDIRSKHRDLRFKEGQNHWINKLIDIMSKEY